MSAIVSPPVSFTFRALQQALLSWTLTDQNGNPISGATVNATLYENLNLQNPTDYPGTPVAGFTNVNLVETPAASGIYVATLPATINPDPATMGFITVIVATSGSTPLGTWNIPTVIVPASNTIDLTTLSDVKAWLGIPTVNTDNDEVIQALITGFSQYVINRTGVASFNSINQYIEIYDGNGSQRLFLRNYPITAIISVLIGSYSVPLSSAVNAPGIFIEQLKRSIAFRAGSVGWFPSAGLFPYTFAPGIGNIQVTYTAGFAQVPYDLQEACFKAVAINYTRKSTIDQGSKTLSASGGGTGTVAFRAWALPPEIERVIMYYSRYGK